MIFNKRKERNRFLCNLLGHKFKEIEQHSIYGSETLEICLFCNKKRHSIFASMCLRGLPCEFPDKKLKDFSKEYILWIWSFCYKYKGIKTSLDFRCLNCNKSKEEIIKRVRKLLK
jgi:hypothetical protein